MDRPLDTDRILDAIAAITSRRESGRLQITVSGSRGAFFFKEGKLLDARMGPFSGLPAVNHAISMGNAKLNFNSQIQPPASTFVAIEERVLLRERFGIETEDATTETEEAALSVPTTPEVGLPEKENARVPVPTMPQVALPEETLPPEARAAPESVQEPVEGNIINSGLRESRIRVARNRVAHRKESQRHLAANRFLNLPAEESRRKAEKEEGGIGNIEHQELGRTISHAITPQVTTSEQAGNVTSKGIYEEEKPEEPSARTLPAELSIEAPAGIETRSVTGNKRCPKCERVYEEFRNYCRYDSTQLVSDSNNSFNSSVKPEAVSLHVLFWTLLAISLAVGGILGYLLNDYMFRKPAEPTSLQAKSEQNSSEAEDQPVVEGTLRGKEVTLTKPEYPAKAKSEGLSGKVTVAIRVNKQGRVVSARALTGHPPLKVAAVAAARQSKFSPENLDRQSFKNSGTITYTFK